MIYSTFAFATAPLTFITYVEPKIVMFAFLRVSFAVIVILRLLFIVARDTVGVVAVYGQVF